MIYSSITPYVHMLYTDEFDQEHVELDFSDPRERGNYYRSGVRLDQLLKHRHFPLISFVCRSGVSDSLQMVKRL